MAGQPLLRGERLSLAFGSAEQPFTAVDGVDVSLDDRRYMAIVGPSGSGKSSLLYLLSGLRQPTSGSVHFRGVDYGAYKLAEWGRRMDPQSPFALCTAAEMLHRTTLFDGTDPKYADHVSQAHLGAITDGSLEG